jgi:hypothetical protein
MESRILKFLTFSVEPEINVGFPFDHMHWHRNIMLCASIKADLKSQFRSDKGNHARKFQRKEAGIGNWMASKGRQKAQTISN